ncbi:basic salivary proline-rich protein 2-like [Branchiostoma lanceolatum]|uniref:basic salivary proline-rich protein 2-like n=1 Tax=Branchiostoma lanceolatum TaxID=7740 RepID=UPI0034566688
MSRKSKTEMRAPAGRTFPFLMDDEQVDAELTVLQREREKLMKKKKVLELRHEIARLNMEATSSQPPPPPQLHRVPSQGQGRASRRRYSSSESSRQGEPDKEVFNKKPSPDIERSNREPKTPPRTTPDVTPEFKNPPGMPVQRQDSRTSRKSTSSRTAPSAPDRDAPAFRNPPPFDLVGMDTLRGAPPEMTPEMFPPEGSRSRATHEIVTSAEPSSSTHSKEKEEFLRRRKEKKEGSSSRQGSVRSTASVRRFSDLAHQPRTGSVSSVRSNKAVRGFPSFESPAEPVGYAEPVAPPRHRRESDPTSPTSPSKTALFDFTQPSGSVRSRTGPPPSVGPPPPPPPPHPSAPRIPPLANASSPRRTGSEPVQRNHAVVPDYGRSPPQSPDGAVSLADFIRQSGVKHQHK